MPTISNSLADLAARINAEHGAVATALQSALGHAISAGELLIEAKRKVAHGQWLPWLETNCTTPQRTAAAYMALSRKRKNLCDKNGNVLRISVHEALGWLRPLRLDQPGDYEEFGEGEFKAWRGLAWGEPFILNSAVGCPALTKVGVVLQSDGVGIGRYADAIRRGGARSCRPLSQDLTA